VHKDEFLTIAEAAVVLSVSKDTIRRRIKAREIKAELRPSPYGDQYYINPIELTGAVKYVDVAKIEQTLTPEELTGLFKQAMQDAMAPLHSEIEALKAELAEDQVKLRVELKAHDSEIVDQSVSKSYEKINTDLVSMSSAVGEALNAQNEALKKEIATLHESIAAIEERQKERESTHYSLVDQRLTELSIESKKGFLARLFNK